MQKLSVFALMTASLGASAAAMAVLPTVALDPVDNNQAAPISTPIVARPLSLCSMAKRSITTILAI